MKKIIVVTVLAGMVGAGIWLIPKIRMGNPWLDGKAEKVDRGDLVIPVSASGTVMEDQKVELKSKANGRIKKVLVKEGQMVTAGQKVIEIDEIDERRNVERLEANLERATAAYEQAKIRQKDAEENRPLDVETAEQLVAQAKAQLDNADLELSRIKGMDSNVRLPLELDRAQYAFNNAKAMYEKAKVDLKRAKVTGPLSIGTAEQDAIILQKAKESAKKDLDEAEERLRECTVTSPKDGEYMVFSIPVTAGQVIQSGTSGFTGGTPLMYLSDIRKMYVVAQVDEADIGSVEKIAPIFARPGHVKDVSDEELIASAPLPPLSSDEIASSQPSTQPVDIGGVSGRRVSVTVDAFRDERFEGIIERILPMPKTVGTVTTFDVRIRLIGKDLARLQSKTADVRFTADRRPDVLRVKNEAIVSEGSNKEVYVYVPYKENPNDPEWEKKVRVEIGLTDGTYTEIISGVKEGDRVWVKRPQRTDMEQKKEEKKKGKTA